MALPAGRSAERAHLVIEIAARAGIGEIPGRRIDACAAAAGAHVTEFPADPFPGARSPAAPDGEAGSFILPGWSCSGGRGISVREDRVQKSVDQPGWLTV